MWVGIGNGIWTEGRVEVSSDDCIPEKCEVVNEGQGDDCVQVVARRVVADGRVDDSPDDSYILEVACRVVDDGIVNGSEDG